MQKNNLLFGIVGLIVGLAIGFFVANKINRDSPANVSANQPTAPIQNQQVQNALVKDQPATSGGMMPDIAATIDKANNQPSDFDAQIKAGDLYLQIKGFDKAVAFYERAQSIKPDDYDLLVKLGNAYFDAGQFEKAANWYEKALAKKSDDVNVRTDLGITFVERANPDYDRAVKEFQTSLKTNPKHEPTLYNLGAAYFKKGNAEEANRVLMELEQINPQSSLVGRLRQMMK